MRLNTGSGSRRNLLRVIGDNLHNRELLYEITKGPVRHRVTAGVAQGSVLGSDL